jgi:hypothetical protein
MKEKSSWLLLVPQLPPRPAYLRVKLWRRLRDIGAVALKNSVHALPDRPDCAESFRALQREIESSGGGALLCEARFPDARGERDVRAAFMAAREADYQSLEKELRVLAQKRPRRRKPELDLKLDRIRQRLAQIAALDFFGARGRKPIDALLTQLEHSHIARSKPSTSPGLDAASLRGRVWVTRQGIHVDRIACAWLILRFIDADAKFRFVADRAYRPRKGELRFDMPGAEFTHEGDQCSFETLLKAAAPGDAALQAIAEIVHDLDIEDGKFGRPEAAGLGLVISGICETQASDMDRIARGSVLLDGVYARLRRKSG